MLEDFHIDLGFDLSRCGPHYREPRASGLSARRTTPDQIMHLDQHEKILLAALQNGLPLVAQPFGELGVPQAFALETIQRWCQQGVIKRFGVIVRHHELGFKANAMVVWDVPDAEVSEVGRRIAASGRVTLCYRRPRQLPHWPYNLFCMIHGKDRAEVETRIVALAQACGLDQYPHNTLFSQTRYKQRGAHYMNASANQEKMKELVHG